MTPTTGAGPFDGALHEDPPTSATLLALVHLIGWATCAGCVVGFVIAAATAMAWKHRCGEDAAAVTPSGDEASASLGVVVLGYAVVGAAGAPVGLVV